MSMHTEYEGEIFLPTVGVLVESAELLQHIRTLFRREKYHLHFYNTLAAGSEQLRTRPFDLFLLAPQDDPSESLEVIQRSLAVRSEMRVIMIVSQQFEPQGVDAVAKGIVHKLLVKPVPDDLILSVTADIVRLEYQCRFESMQKKLASFRSLPAPSRFQERMKQLLAKRDRSMRELVTEIEKNPALVAKVLQVANSVHFWTRAPITTVWDAVILIGTQNIASLIAAIEIFENIGRNASPEVRAYYELLWNRSLTRANIAKKIAEEWEEMKDPQVAYVTALLQDIGLLIRLVNEPERYRDMMHRTHAQHISTAEAELQVFTHCHTALGAFLLQLWNFPKNIVYAVAHHHGSAYDDPLTQTIQMADVLSLSDSSIPHDPSIDPFLDIWTARLGNILNGIVAEQEEKAVVSHDKND